MDAGMSLPGAGIYAWALKDVQIVGNSISHSRGPAISSVGGTHVIIATNLLVADSMVNASAITVLGSTDVMIQGNNARGFGQAIAVGTDAGKCDRVQISGNSLDLSGMLSNASGVLVGSSTARVLVADNVVSGSSGLASCVRIEGATVATRSSRDNMCW